MNSLRALIEFLKDPSLYPDRPDRVECIETHISLVFLTNHFAFKLKKPVWFEFLDFSTLEKRHAACLDELHLHRRLTRDLYLEVLPITVGVNGLQFSGNGQVVDYVVKMRRLDQNASLQALILQDCLEERHISVLAERLADFYQQMPPLNIVPNEYRKQIVDHVLANSSELSRPAHKLDSVVIRRVHAAQLRLLHLNPELFDTRVCDGRIVDGHGDLRPEHIYSDPEPQIIDCIEFNAEFRSLDVLDELSFLGEECARMGAPQVGAGGWASFTSLLRPRRGHTAETIGTVFPLLPSLRSGQDRGTTNGAGGSG